MIKTIKYFPYLARRYYDISRFEKWSKERIERYQINAFKKIYESAKQIPFYRDLYQRAGVGDLTIKSLDDLKGLPIIDKAICREGGYEDYILNQSIPNTITLTTSGTTGKRFQIKIPGKIEMIPPLKVIYAMKQYGWKPFYKGLEIYQENISTHKSFMRRVGLLKYESIMRPLSGIMNRIKEEQPDYLFSYRSFYTILADFLEDNNFHYHPKYLLCTAEEVHDHHRERLESYFKAKLINFYGCMEAPAIAYSCPEYDRLHVFQTTVVIEVVNKKNIDGEEYGDIVLSNLTNHIMPFIRYRIGDMVKIVGDRCNCKRNSQILGDILGRSDDGIKLKDGRVLTQQHLTRALRSVTIIDQYKAIYRRNDDVIEFLIRLKDNTDRKEGEILLSQIIQRNFPQFRCNLSIVDRFQVSKNGKFKVLELID